MPLPSEPISLSSLQDVTFDPLDVDHATIEMLEQRILMLSNVKSQVQVLLPALIEGASNWKRDLDKGKQIAKWAKEEITACQSVLKSMRANV